MMAPAPFKWNFGSVIAVAVICVLWKMAIRWRQRTFMRRHRCEPITSHPANIGLSPNFDKRRQQAADDGRINEFCLEQYEVCGSSTFWLSTVNEQMIWTMDPENHQKIATRLDDWIKEDRHAMRPFYGPNILTENGVVWKTTREAINPLFKHAELKDIGHFKKFVDRMLLSIPHDDSTVDMQALFRRLSLDNSTEFIFGESVGSLANETSSQIFIDTFNRASAQANDRFMTTGIRSLLHHFGVWNKEWLEDIGVVHSFVDGCITRYRDSPRTGVHLKGTNSSDRYVLMKEMSKRISDPVALRYQLMGIFSIALETAAMGFTNILFVMARNLGCWTELRKQATRMDEAETTDYVRLRDLTLFRHVISECFRLHSPVTRVRAVAAHDTFLPRGGGSNGSAPAFVPKGSIIVTDKYPISLDTAVWGDDAADFRPARFEGKALGWEFSPFSGGPRICPAHQQMILQCTYLLMRLTREFEAIENRDPCREYKEGVFTCFYSRNGCQVAFRRPQT